MDRLPCRAAVWSRQIPAYGAYIRYPRLPDFAIMAPIKGIDRDCRATRIAVTLVPNSARAPRGKDPNGCGIVLDALLPSWRTVSNA